MCCRQQQGFMIITADPVAAIALLPVIIREGEIGKRDERE